MRLSKKLSMAACTMALTAMTTAAMAAPAVVPMEKLYTMNTDSKNGVETTVSFTAKDLTDAIPFTGADQGAVTITTKDGQKLFATIEDGSVIDFSDYIDLSTLTEEQREALKKSPLQMKVIQSGRNENGDGVAKISVTPAVEVMPAVSINN